MVARLLPRRQGLMCQRLIGAFWCLLAIVALSACDGPAQYKPVQANVLLLSDGTGEMNWVIPYPVSDAEANDVIRLYAEALGLPEPTFPPEALPQLSGLPQDEITLDLDAFVKAIEDEGLGDADSIFVSVCVPPRQGRVEIFGGQSEILGKGACATFDPGIGHDATAALGSAAPRTIVVTFQDRTALGFAAVLPIVLGVIVGLVALEALIRRRVDGKFRILAFSVAWIFLIFLWLIVLRFVIYVPSGFDSSTEWATGVSGYVAADADGSVLAWTGRRVAGGVLVYAVIRFIVLKRWKRSGGQE